MLKFLGTVGGIRPGKAASNPASGSKISEPEGQPPRSVDLAPRDGQLDAQMRPHAALPALSRQPSQHGEIRECNPTLSDLLADERQQEDAQRAQLVHSALPNGSAAMRRLTDRAARAHPATRVEQWHARLNGRPKPLNGGRMQAFGAMLQADVMGAPVVWLASEASNNFTGKRIIAQHWDERLPLDERLAKSSAPAAWPQLGRQAIYPE